MKNIFLICMSLLLSEFGWSQDGENDPYPIHDSTNIEQITEWRTFLNGNNPQTIKSVTYLNKNGRMYKYEQYNPNSELVYSNLITFDSTGKFKIKVNTFDKLIPEFEELSTFVSYFFYNDKGLIIKKIQKTIDDSILTIQLNKYNERNDLIEFKYLKPPSWIMKFMADYEKDSIYYDYQKNISIDYTLSHSNEPYMIMEGEIKHVKKNFIYNKKGDVIMGNGLSNNYEYDKRGNWVLKISSIMDKEIYKFWSKTKREIKYRSD